MKVNTIEATFHLAHGIKQQLSGQLEVKKLGIAPMHIRVLKVIDKRRHCTVNDMAALFKRDKAQITRLVKQLIDMGFVKKEANPADKRSQFLVLTAQGKTIQHSVSGLSQALHEQMIQGIDAADLARFVDVAEQMTKNLIKDKNSS